MLMWNDQDCHLHATSVLAFRVLFSNASNTTQAMNNKQMQNILGQKVYCLVYNFCRQICTEVSWKEENKWFILLVFKSIWRVLSSWSNVSFEGSEVLCLDSKLEESGEPNCMLNIAWYSRDWCSSTLLHAVFRRKLKAVHMNGGRQRERESSEFIFWFLHVLLVADLGTKF